MAKLILNTILGQYASVIALNTNNDLVEAALENTLSLDGTYPNSMQADLDINSNNILNANLIQTTSLRIGGTSVVPGDVLSVPTAANVPNIPAGDISAIDVQAAINELDTEKVGLAGNESIAGDKTLTGSTVLSGSATLSGATSISGALTTSNTVDLSSSVLQGSTPLVFEGGTDDSFETSLVITDPTADRTITFPDSDLNLGSPVPAFKAGVTEYLFDQEGAHATSFDVVSNITPSTFGVVGPTGSPAVINWIWTALDDLPLNALWADIRIYNRISGTTTNVFYSSTVYGWGYNTLTSPGFIPRVMLSSSTFEHNSTAGNDQNTTVDTIRIPLGVNNKFYLGYSSTGTSPVPIVSLYLVGFGV